MVRSPCCEKEHTNKGAWTREEDERLVKYIKEHGEGCWRSLPKAAGLQRCGKSCRLRWINYLRPDLKRGNFTEEEDDLIINLHSLLGNKWSLIAARLPGRTDNEIKNYWNTHIRRKLLSRGIDPQTHRPLSSAAITTTKSNRRTNNYTCSNNNNVQTLQFQASFTPIFPNLKDSADLAEESHSNSSVLTEELKPQLNLELSIKPPQQPEPFRINTEQLKQQQKLNFGVSNMATIDQTVCLCYQLGFQNNNSACHCKTFPHRSNDDMYRYYRPLSL